MAANQAGVPRSVLNAMSWGYIGLRVTYNFVYINLGGNRKTHWMRSLVWGLGVITSVGLFVTAGVYSVKGNYLDDFTFENI